MGRRLAGELAEPARWTIYASPLGRARQTALLVCEQLGLAADRIVWDDRLMELGMGEWESCQIPVLRLAHPELDTGKGDWYLQAPGAESFESIQRRAHQWLQDPAIAERAIVISHGLLGAMLRGVYADLDYEATWSQELPQDAFYKLQDGHITRIAC
ncbi:MAG: histidine phosphatase family protein, partial [Aeromonas veronii]